MKTIKYSLFSILFISSTCLAKSAPQDEITLSSLLEIISFCTSDNICSSITPVIKENELNYSVIYEKEMIDLTKGDDTPPIIIAPTDPLGDGI